MGLYHILSRLSQRDIYSNQGNYPFFLKELAEETSDTIIPDTNCLILGFNFLKESFEDIPCKEKGLYQVHGQLKALKNMGENGRLKILPHVQKEYHHFSQEFMEILMKNRFKYSFNREIDKGLFQLYCDTRDLNHLIDFCVSDELERKASLFYSNEDISSQLITSYFKNNETKHVSKEDQMLYLAGILSHNTDTFTGNSTHILTSDIDFLVQPQITFQGNTYTVPIIFPSKPIRGKLRNSSFSKFEHMPLENLLRYSFYNFG